MPFAVGLSLAVSLQASFPQSPPATPGTTLPSPTVTLVVLGSAAPVPLAESPSSVLVLPVGTNVLSLESPQDLLRQDPSVFLEQRGAGGGQADVVMRGGTFEQTLVLLNGFRINDSQTAQLPETAVLASLGCGNPTALAELNLCWQLWSANGGAPA